MRRLGLVPALAAAAVLVAWLAVQEPPVAKAVAVGTAGLVVAACLRTWAGSWLAPQCIIALVWSVALALAQLDVRVAIPYQNDSLSIGTWMVIVGALATFAIGATVSSSALSKAASRATTLPEPWDDRRLRRAVRICFLAATTAYVVLTLQAGGFPLFSPAPALARQDFRTGFFAYLLALYVIVVVLTAVRLVRYGGLRRNRAEVVMSVVAFAAMLGTAARSDAFEALAFSAFTALLLSQRASVRGWKLGARPLAFFVPVIVVAFIAVSNVRGTGQGGVAYNANFISIQNRNIAAAYLYLAPLASKNLQYGIAHGPPHSSGQAILRAPIGWLGGDTFQGPDYWNGWNTGTFLWTYYLDFGYLGTLLVPFGLGVASGGAFVLAWRRRSMAWVLVYSVIATAILWSVSTDRFFEPITFHYVVLIVLVHLYCRRRTRPHRPSDQMAPQLTRPRNPSARSSSAASAIGGRSWVQNQSR